MAGRCYANYEEQEKDSVELEECSQKAMKKSRWQVFIDNQPKVMKTIIANEGGRTKY